MEDKERHTVDGDVSRPGNDVWMDAAPLMREQDADFLESLHLKGSNPTPQLRPAEEPDSSSATTPLRPPPFYLDEDESHSSRRRYSNRSTLVIEEDEERPTTAQHLNPLDSVRRALSGEIWINDNAPTEPPVEEVIQRPESLDRQLSEAAQFAEAVGDMPPQDRRDLRIIEETEDGEDEEDDDDGHEIHVPDAVSTSGAVEHSPRPRIRPQWPYPNFLDQLMADDGTSDYVYRGLRANPPEIVKRGTTRGNYAQLHRKAWLEVSDKYHRYGKNLRLYYRYWERLGCPTNMFFDWLDSKGEAAGKSLPELVECPRAQLDSDTVLYITNPEVTDGYAIGFETNESGRVKLLDIDEEPVCTGPDGWIFVLRDGVLYGAKKVTSISGLSKQRFHHSSFFGGKAVAAAGIFITDEEGYLTMLYPHSGHYRPGEAHVQRVLFFLYSKGADLRTFEMDTQQIQHVARDVEAPKDEGEKTEKKKKIESLHLMPAVLVAFFLAHKARFIGEGIFDQIHRIRKADVTSVSEALDLID